MISLIVAHTKNNVIGNKGDIPWKLSDDLKRFKALTTGKSIIMGRKTFDSLGRALPNRRNIVITRKSQFNFNGVEVASSLDEALKLTKDEPEVFVIGGGEIYKQAMDKADRIYATILEQEIEGDTHFPRVNLNHWQLDKLEKHHDDLSDIDYYYADYVRRKKPAKLYFIDASRHLDQTYQMEDLEKRQACVFCEKDFKQEHREPIEIETKHWMVTKNDYPYTHTKLHLLYVPKKHANTLAELDPAALTELPVVLARIEKQFKLKSYAQFMRVGDFRYNGATVHHLHGHIVVGDSEHPDFDGVYAKLASKPRL